MKDDTISRAAAVDTLMMAKTIETSITGRASNAGVDWCIDAIKALPTAQQWIKTTPDTMPPEGRDVLVAVYDTEDDSRFIITDQILNGDWINCDGIVWIAYAWTEEPDLPEIE